MANINNRDYSVFRECGRVTEVDSIFATVTWNKSALNWDIPQDTENRQLLVNIWPADNPLSNCSAFPIKYEGVVYPSVEHAYHIQRLQKCAPYHQQGIEKIYDAHTGEAAAKAAERYLAKISKRELVFISSKWDTMKVRIMYELISAKLDQNQEPAVALLASGNLPIVEIVPEAIDALKTDWGVTDPTCTTDFAGRNFCGRILMRLRTAY